jgi:hypothetical protein
MASSRHGSDTEQGKTLSSFGGAAYAEKSQEFPPFKYLNLVPNRKIEKHCGLEGELRCPGLSG